MGPWPRRALSGWTVRLITVRSNCETIDASASSAASNHPLAGQNLNFQVEVAEVREASAEELEHGHVHGPGGHGHDHDDEDDEDQDD